MEDQTPSQAMSLLRLRSYERAVRQQAVSEPNGNARTELHKLADTMRLASKEIEASLERAEL
jgi:hypothetical protein